MTPCFPTMGSMAAWRYHISIAASLHSVHGLTPLLRVIGCILFWTMSDTNTRRVLCARIFFLGGGVWCIQNLVTSPLGEVRNIGMSMYVTMFVCLSSRITGKPHSQLHKIFVHAVCGHCSVFHLRRCDTLSTSGLWITSRFHTMGPMGHIKQIDFRYQSDWR